MLSADASTGNIRLAGGVARLCLAVALAFYGVLVWVPDCLVTDPRRICGPSGGHLYEVYVVLQFALAVSGSVVSYRAATRSAGRATVRATVIGVEIGFAVLAVGCLVVPAALIG